MGHAAKFAKSAMVPPGYQLSIFAQDNFKERIQQIVGGFEEEGDGRNNCVDFEGGKEARSMRITRAVEGRITSYWKPITASETLTYTVAVGIHSTDSKVDKDSSVEKLTNSLKTGISMGGKLALPGSEMLGLAAGPTLNIGGTMEKTREESKEKTIAREITSTSSSDVTQTYSTSCSATDDVKSGGVGLWQWVLETEDHSTTASTSHTVCRFGALATVEPACDWFSCLNDDCSKCE